MAHWKLTLSYDGSDFHGWQVQPGLTTIQGTLAQAIQYVTSETVLPQGSGRTDAGVHALAQVASFSLRAPIPSANLQRALNRSLPPSIRVLSAEAVPPHFHARHSAVAKTYEYRLFDRGVGGNLICPPFLAPYVWDCRWSLDLDRMNAATAAILGEHDFASFAASDPDQARRAGDAAAPSNVRTMFSAAWKRECAPCEDPHPARLLTFRIRGDGFLHHMVRNVVGTLVEVGRGSLAAADMQRVLAARDRSVAGPTAPAGGLFLVSVEYAPSSASAENPGTPE